MAHLSISTFMLLLLSLLNSCRSAPAISSNNNNAELLLDSPDYPPKRNNLRLIASPYGPSRYDDLFEARETRGSGMGTSFIRYGRDLAVSQPHTRSDIIIRYGKRNHESRRYVPNDNDDNDDDDDDVMTIMGKRDEINNRLARLRQERMQRLARLALVCANKSQEEMQPSSAEERIIREMCRDAPLHPTVPDFV